jgi:hypothetical protein
MELADGKSLRPESLHESPPVKKSGFGSRMIAAVTFVRFVTVVWTWSSAGPEFGNWVTAQPTSDPINERPLWSEQIAESKVGKQP